MHSRCDIIIHWCFALTRLLCFAADQKLYNGHYISCLLILELFLVIVKWDNAGLLCVDWQESQMKWEEYEEIASSLLDWLQQATSLMLDKNFPTTYNELKVYSHLCHYCSADGR